MTQETNDDHPQETNDHLVMVCGKSATGKSASLRELEKQAGVWYANCEAGKKLPFRSKFRQFTITDPHQLYELFDHAETDPTCHTIAIDSQTYLMDMYESNFVVGSADGQKAWGEFAQFWKKLMQTYVARSTKKVIFTAHTADQLNASEMTMETKIPVKGSLKSNGIESYFTVVIASKKVTIKQLENMESDLLTITEEEKALGFKYVFQTRITKETVGERIRGPLGLFSTKETFIDNNMQLVLNRLEEYYSSEEAPI